MYDAEARDVIHKLYGAHWDKKDFAALVDSVVIDEELPGSTPQKPVKHVRTLVINSYRNTIDPSQRFKASLFLLAVFACDTRSREA